MLFKTTADYLLGFTDYSDKDYPKYSNVSKRTGLSIEALKNIDSLQKQQKDNQAPLPNAINLLNYILSDYLIFYEFLWNIGLLANCGGFDTPCYMENGCLKPIPNTTPPDIIYNPNKEKHITIGKADKNGFYDGFSVPVSASIKGYAINNINDIVNAWANKFQKEGE